MKCIKNGFYAKLPNGFYLYGDAFTSGSGAYGNEANRAPRDDLILRVCSMSDEIPSHVHIRLETWTTWFDERAGSPVGEGAIVWNPSSTLIAEAHHWEWLGYNGVQL